LSGAPRLLPGEAGRRRWTRPLERLVRRHSHSAGQKGPSHSWNIVRRL